MVLNQKVNFFRMGSVKIPHYLEGLCMVLLFGYFSIGVFPFALYETDALGVIAGCKKILETGRFEENYYTYNFQTQPGIYFWVITIHKVVQISLVTAYSAISALFGIGFVLLSAYFLSRCIRVSFFVSTVSLFIFQEVYSAWYYMNSATGAAFFMMAAFVLILSGNRPIRFIVSGILLALSAWTRFDVIILFPVIIILVPHKSIWVKFIRAAITFFTFLVAIFILCYLSNATNVLLEAMNGGGSLSFVDNQKTASSFFTSQFIRAFAGCFSILSLVLIAWGLWLLKINKDIRVFFIFLVPVFLFLLFIAKHVVAGKHLLYYIPFFAIPVTYTFKWFITANFSKRLTFIGIVLPFFLLQYVLGIRVSLPSHPYVNEPYVSVKPEPTIFSLGTINVPLNVADSITFVIGCGTKLSTSDEMLLSSGILFSPLMWYKLKQESQVEYNSISELINSTNEDTLHMTTSQGGVYPVKNLLYLNGFTLTNPENKLYVWGLDYTYKWRKPGKVIIVDQATYPKDSYAKYVTKIRENKADVFTHIAFFDWERWYVNQYSQPHKKISNVAYQFAKR
ncbi:hypothetical protein [Spirosoma fluviale]|uniref:4-amino-4-deoxy-L-arabinose transferase n=1 Tax=Spirosoma fluviale TaxID=1597977 RepID=A0A286FDC9_9BACT|nr:hypothetical protein [Spirosoma fluviale]SOD81251.1 4-amino-4-deoxy-L-arabinose transferase [Spirosoma fluviale]